MTERLAPLIPRRTFFGNPDRLGVRVSRDGEYLSWIAPDAGVLNVFVAPRGEPGRARCVTSDRVRGIREHFWCFDRRHLVYLQDEAGDENWHVHAVDVETGEQRDLTPLAGVSARVEAVSDELPQSIVLGLNDRDPSLHDLWLIELATGERELLLENEGFAGFVLDASCVPRLAGRMTEDGGVEYLRREGEGWSPFLRVGMEDALTTAPLSFDRSGRRLYMRDSRGRDTAAVVVLDLDTGLVESVAASPRADAADLLRNPDSLEVQAVAFDWCRKEWKVLDEAVAADLTLLRAEARGDVEITSRSRDDRWWTTAHLADDGPVRYHLWDRQAKSAQFLFTSRSALEDVVLTRMAPQVLIARDRLELVSYLSLPAQADGSVPDRPDEPGSAVLDVHGGPWQRDRWGYDPIHQLLSNRGHAVLSVNFRGSTGFGKGFLNAASHEWGAAMHEDLLDGVEWLVGEGIAARDRIGILGGSYGGYATLVGLTMTPEVFACGVDIVGPSSLVTLLESVPPYWKPQQQVWKSRVGDHETEEGRRFLLSRSPLTHVDRIRRPLLIAQGANDPRVKKAESDQIVAQMQAKGIPVTYALFPDEGHGFARPANNLAFFALAEAFLSVHLGGRAEPLGPEDLAGSSLQVLAGAEAVPGLSELLSERAV